MEARIIDLESRIAFQEDAIQALNLTVSRQQRRLDELQGEIEALQALVRQMAMQSAPLADPADETPPPHY